MHCLSLSSKEGCRKAFENKIPTGELNLLKYLVSPTIAARVSPKLGLTPQMNNPNRLTLKTGLEPVVFGQRALKNCFLRRSSLPKGPQANNIHPRSDILSIQMPLLMARSRISLSAIPRMGCRKRQVQFIEVKLAGNLMSCTVEILLLGLELNRVYEAGFDSPENKKMS